MPKAHLVVSVFEYLKTPYWTWFYNNEHGGGFSNCGKQSTLKATLLHFVREQQRIFTPDAIPLTQVKLRRIHGYDIHDKAIETVEITDLATLLKRAGVK